MLSTSRLFPSGPVTLNLRDLLSRLKAADVILASWHDPIKGLQVMPVGDEQAVGPKKPGPLLTMARHATAVNGFWEAHVADLGPGDLVKVECLSDHVEMLTGAMLLRQG